MCVSPQFVVFTFWSLYLYDRELVYPKLLDNFIPQWLNHGMVSSILRSPEGTASIAVTLHVAIQSVQLHPVCRVRPVSQTADVKESPF